MTEKHWGIPTYSCGHIHSLILLPGQFYTILKKNMKRKKGKMHPKGTLFIISDAEKKRWNIFHNKNTRGEKEENRKLGIFYSEKKKKNWKKWRMRFRDEKKIPTSFPHSSLSPRIYSIIILPDLMNRSESYQLLHIFRMDGSGWMCRNKDYSHK